MNDLKEKRTTLEERVAQARKASHGRPEIWEATRRIMRGGNREQVLAELRETQTAWDATNPEGAAAYASIDALEQELETTKQAIFAKARAEESMAAALALLDDVPRVQAKARAGVGRSEAVDIVEEFARKPSLWCLLMLGGVGCGKSTATGCHLVAVASRLEAFGDRLPVWVRAVEASRLSGFGEATEARLETWRRAPLLVIDDLGTEMMTATWQQTLDDVLDYRYEHSLRTILPTNLDAVAFKTRYGERITDRIREQGMVRQLSSKSLRGVAL